MTKISKFPLLAIALLSVFVSFFLFTTNPVSAVRCDSNTEGECTLNDQPCFQAGRYRACKISGALYSEEICLIAVTLQSPLPNEGLDKGKIETFCGSAPTQNVDKAQLEEQTKQAQPTQSTDDGQGSNNNNGQTESDPTNFSFNDEDCGEPFLGLIAWCDGVNIHDQESLKYGIWQIAANVVTDITIIAAYLIIGYVIYGGYLYMLSAGDTGKVATGKKALTQAFIGLAIIMSAHIILATIRVILLGAEGKLDNCATEACATVPGTVIINALQWAIGVAGFVAAIFVVYGGISYATSSGEAAKLQKAKQTILYALIGLAIVALAELITAFVSNIIRDATSTSQINQTIIVKELHENKTT